jgi:hypothetical protein
VAVAAVAAEPEGPRPQAPGGLKPLAAAVQVEMKAEPSRFAGDAAGKQVEESLTPKVPPPPAGRVTAPKPRASAVDRGDLPPAKPGVTAAPLPQPARKSALPTPPGEGVAAAGVGMELDLAERKLPESPRVSSPPRPQPSAADVPRMAVQVPDRAPTDDPTAELSTARIVNTLLLAPPIAAPFLRLVLPDPFEFAEQVKPPATSELATAPAFVPPAKP